SCPQQADQIPPGTFSPSLVTALKAQAGQVIKLDGDNDRFTTTAGVGKVDWNWSLTHKNLVPGQFPDCNPYGILAGEHDQWVVHVGSRQRGAGHGCGRAGAPTQRRACRRHERVELPERLRRRRPQHLRVELERLSRRRPWWAPAARRSRANQGPRTRTGAPRR